MTLTGQIIRTIIKEEIKSAQEENQAEFVKINKKLDKIGNTIDSFAGQVRNFDTEQVLQGGRLSSNTDRIEKLELDVFGTIQLA
ncbi:MAG: hypothetical protein G01um101416_1185 [Microgenomates group bacterium Gr01-1014_16]|nr:MAG: hypothetical protein G01um101416_1185 [Microgenomates group bacterium Gr01-1014_16]